MDWKGRSKTFFAKNITVHIENCKKSTKIYRTKMNLARLQSYTDQYTKINFIALCQQLTLGKGNVKTIHYDSNTT